MANRKSDFTLPTHSLDELFSSQEGREAIKYQGITSRQVDEKLLSITQVSKDSDDSER